jgi:hypothetical protein
MSKDKLKKKSIKTCLVGRQLEKKNSKVKYSRG